MLMQPLLGHTLSIFHTALLLTAWSGASMLIDGNTALAKSRIPLLRANSHGLELVSAKPSPDALGGPGRQVRVPTEYTGDLINGKKWCVP
jgi:hypothetical protein